MKIYFLFQYSDKLIRKLILDLKNNHVELAYFWGLALSEFLIYLFNSKINRNIYISYVPISLEKFNLRNYNQAELIAIYFHKFLLKRKSENKIVLLKDLFLRTKNTEALFKLNSEERKEELNEAFKFNLSYKPLIEKISSSRENIILIIDDISTTGNTIVNLSKLLIDNGFPVERVLGLTCTGRNFE
ncbi:MAG: ComF family protein [Candidatus Caenarcaniphilales bacterium]|nr:ComF family protein [Candidatus Caenarcaniphilales bacterium]